jgi:DNA-binding LacI/PurR family transcriptional regulator
MTASSPRIGKSKIATDEKYPILIEYFLSQIRSGQLKAGDRLPTFLALQQQFGVASNTVNRAMISLEQQGVIERRRGSGVYVTQPTDEEQRVELQHTKNGIIGLCGLGFGLGSVSPYWMRLLEGVRQGVETSGAQLLLLNDIRGEGWEKVDGVILSGWSDGDYVDQILSQIPMVCLFTAHPERVSITADEYSGTRAATEHLLKLGHKRIAFLHDNNNTSVPSRLRAYRDALCEAGITPHKDWKRRLSGKNDVGLQFVAAGRRDMKAWLKNRTPDGWKQMGCTALLCHNDEVAVGAMQSLRESGLRVPDDVSVVGFDGTDIGEYSSPRLTSVQMPLREMGEAAVSLLEKQIQSNKNIVEHQVMPTRLEFRESTATVRRD